MWKMIKEKMILNRKSCEPDKIDNLIEELYMRTKTALLNAQNSTFSANNDVKPEDTFEEIPNCVIEENVSSSSKSDLFESSSSNLLNSNLSCKLDTVSPPEQVGETETCNTELLSHNESQSKVVVQVLPKVEFGDKFDLLESGISHKTAGFTPSTFHLTPIQPVSHLISPDSDVEEFSFSDEDSIKNEDDLSNASSVFTNDEAISPYLGETHMPRFKSDNKYESPPRRECMQINSANSKLNKECKYPTCEAHQSFCGDFLIYPGNGIKLGDIEYISSELANASAPVVRILHYILYGAYGLTGNDTLLSQTRQNILLFSGFHFSEQSEVYQKKRNSLLNLPYPLLGHIYNILVNAAPRTRLDSVEAVLNFLKKPSGELHVKKSVEEQVSSETEKLKKRALDARPIVLLKRLKKSYIELMLHKKWEFSEHRDPTTSEKYNKPAFIRNCSGVQLKHFPKVVINIQNARRRIINLLHSLLFGRPGSENSNRRNILEFSGFTIHQKVFVGRRATFLNRLKLKELSQLCDVFTLRAKSGSKSKKIKKLLNFLRTPGAYLNKTEKMKHTLQLQKAKHILRTVKESREQSKEISHHKDPRHQIVEKCTVGASNVMEGDKHKVKLRDFENISSNVECATAEDLTELNDLLYVKPCDNSEIHQKILDFTPFTFNMNSFDFHYRRTLMHYMNLKTVRKIAQVLDIERWEYYTSHQDLALSILKFLMDMKLPEKKKKSSSNLKNKKPRPHILKLQSYNDRGFSKSRSRTPETFDSTYASEEMNDNEYEWGVPNHIYYKGKTPYSKCRHRKNGLSRKHEYILNDSTPLLDFIQHPTERELGVQIDKIINSTSLAITMGDLVKEVLNFYPNFNLNYRIDFIKSKALEILQELRQSATTFPD